MFSSARPGGVYRRCARVTVVGLLVGAVTWVSLVGCATRTRMGAVTGAGIGAGLGALLGGATAGKRGAVMGGAIGAGIGLFVGTLVGQHMDRRTGDRAAAARQLAYVPDAGNIVRLNRFDVVPASTQSGEEVMMRIEFAVIAPIPDLMVDLSERYMLRHNERDVLQSTHRELRADQGIHMSESTFRLPADLPAGHYTVLTILRIEGQMAQDHMAQATLFVENPRVPALGLPR